MARTSMMAPKNMMRAQAASQRAGARLVWLTVRYQVVSELMTRRW
jgi:hypothetical protein